MKRVALLVVSIMLLAAVVCSASASYQGVTKKGVKAYYDKYRQYYATTIPSYTIVKVMDMSFDLSAGRNIAKIYAGKGRYLYVYDSTLYSGFDALNDSIRKMSAEVIKGSRIYQRPNASSNSKLANKSFSVIVCGIKGDWALTYSEYDGGFGFVRKSSLTNILE